MSQVELVWILKSLILPPGGLVLLLLLGMLFRARLLGKFLMLISTALLYLLSTPYVAHQLAGGLEEYPPVDTRSIGAQSAQAIVVLGGGGTYRNAPEYGGDNVGAILLERLRYAAELSRQTGLPVIPSGGSDPRSGAPEADISKQTLENLFRVRVLAVENQSRTTWQNAKFSAEVLKELGIKKVLLVTHAWHMKRAKQAFHFFDIDTVAAPTGFTSTTSNPTAFWAWLPSVHALQSSYTALHEYLGRYWYQIKTLSV